MIANNCFVTNCLPHNSTMECFHLEDDVAVCCLKADSSDIADAHEKLQRMLGKGRRHFGIAFPHEGELLYWAAAEINEQVYNETPGCEMFVVKRGNYMAITASGLSEDIVYAGHAFTRLINNPGISPSSCFVTCYLTEGGHANNVKDVRYMVRLAG